MNWRLASLTTQCAFGCEVPRGALVALGARGFAFCEPCARRRYGLVPVRIETGATERDRKSEQLPTGDR